MAYWNVEDATAGGQADQLKSPGGKGPVLGAAANCTPVVVSEDVVASPPGPEGNKLSMDFSSGKGGLQAEDEPALNFGDGAAFTIEFWIKPRSYTASEDANIARVILQKRGAAGKAAPGYQINLMHDGKIGVRLEGKEGGGKTLFSVGSAPLGEWTHVAVMRTAEGVLSIFLNGVLDATAGGPKFAGSIENDGALALGYHRLVRANPDFYFDGWLDEIRISDAALAPQELLHK